MTKEHFKKIRWTGGMKAICSGVEYDVISCDMSKHTILILGKARKEPFKIPCEIAEIVGQEEKGSVKGSIACKKDYPLSDDEWRDMGTTLFGKNRDDWKFACPKCNAVSESYVKCTKCGFSAAVKITPPLNSVIFCGCKVPVFPFAEVAHGV